jgi:hypothetical protein
MHDHLRHLIIGSSLVLSACEVEDELELEQPELGQPTQHGSIDEVAAGNEAELRIMEGLDADCVDIQAPIITRIDPFTTTCKFDGFVNYEANWVPASLFDEGSPMLNSIPGALPVNSPLRQFCRYDYIGDGIDLYGDYADFMGYLRGPNPPDGVDGDSAAVDCPVIAPMTDEGLDTANGRMSMHEAFLANLHAITPEDLEGVTRHDTRLVLLDTVAEGYAPYNEHGLLLEQLIANIACPGDTATCLNWIEHVLVTPRLPDDDYATADWHGGNVGYMHEFSMGLAFALLDWAGPNLALPVQDRQRLVVSAAVGADPNHPIASDPNYAPAQSAIVALEAAYCMGAVVYAAAGNTRDNSCPNAETQMLAPATYESFVVPTATQCSSWGYLADNPGHTYWPGSALIQAVGGLDGRDQPIANHRRDAHPRLHATASDAISKTGSVAITGTSVATAAAAGAHLLRWSIEPDQPGNSVAKHLYHTGYDIGENADDGMYVAEPIHRLAICPALSDVLDLSCKTLSPDAHGYLDVYALTIEDAIEAADLATLLIEAATPMTGHPANCIGGPEFDVFVNPQPERPACSNCNGVLTSGGNTHMLNMSIANQSWTVDLDVTAAYLHTYDAAGNATTFSLGAVVPNINAAIPSNVIQVQFTVPAPASAVLEFSYYDAAQGTYTKQSNAIPLL